MTKTNEFFDQLQGVWQNKIDGDWVDRFGWNFISQPKLGVPDDSDFAMRVDQMRETISFKKLGGSARNVGVTGSAGFWDAMAYEIGIHTPDDQDIHHEMGHFLLKVQENGQTREELKGNIIRQATIPRANAMMTAGLLIPASVTDSTPFYDARPVAPDQTLQATIDTELAKQQAVVTQGQGPSLRKPLEWLANTLQDGVVGIDWEFGFRNDDKPSQMANGQRVDNPVGIGNLLSDFWIGKRKRDDGSVIEVLQYAQKVDLIFNGMNWPHLAVNTLIKQPG